MAKSRSREEEPTRSTQKADPQRATRFIIVGGVVAVMLLVAGVIAFGYWWSEVRPWSKTVLQVEDTKISLRHLQHRVNLSVSETSIQIVQQFGPENYVNAVRARLKQEAVLVEAADELAITANDQEVDERILQRGNLVVGAPDAVFAAELRRQLDQTGLSRSEFQLMIKAEVLEDELTAHFTELAPDQAPQVRYRVLSADLEDEEALQAVLGRLQAGEEFATVVEELTLSLTSSEEDWTVREGLGNDEIEDFLFAAELGARSEIITASAALFVVELLEREEDRELEDSQRQLLGQIAFNDWQREQELALEISEDFDLDDLFRTLSDFI